MTGAGECDKRWMQKFNRGHDVSNIVDEPKHYAQNKSEYQKHGWKETDITWPAGHNHPAGGMA